MGYGVVLLVFEVLPNGEDILTRATEVNPQERLWPHASRSTSRLACRVNSTLGPGSGAEPTADRPKKDGHLRVRVLVRRAWEATGNDASMSARERCTWLAVGKSARDRRARRVRWRSVPVAGSPPMATVDGGGLLSCGRGRAGLVMMLSFRERKRSRQRPCGTC